MQNLNDLKSYQDQFRRDRFGRKIVELIPSVNPYVHHRLYIAMELGVIPRNMYTDSDVVDDAIVTLFEQDLNRYIGSYDLKIELFKLVKQKLDNLFKEESWHKQTISTDKILQQELNKLKEQFSVEADDDLVMQDELSDISYHQKDLIIPLQLYDDAQHSIISAFDLKQWEKPHNGLFHKMYNFMSLEASNVVDLYVFGKLNSSEIAQIKEVEEPVIREIILQVKDKMANLLKESI